MVETETAPGAVEYREKITPSSEMLGLQGRVLLQNIDLINPNNDVQESDLDPPDKLGIPTTRNYSVFQNVSDFDRGSYWLDKVINSKVEDNYNIQKGLWVKTMVKGFNSERNREYIDKLSNFLLKSNLHIDLKQGFGEVEAKKLYDLYFGDKQPSNNEGISTSVQTFVLQMIRYYVSEDSNKIDVQRLQEDKAAIQWFSIIFGETSKEIVTNIIEAECKLLIDDEGFISELKKTTPDGKMRINDIKENTREKKLLEYIYKHGLVPAEEQLTSEKDRLYSEIRPLKPENITREPFPFDLPEIQQQVMEKIRNNNRCLITAGTGSGKTTRIPQIIVNSEEFQRLGGKVFVSQPTRINTSNTAAHIASLMGLTLGEEVGYQHGEDKEHRDAKKEKIFIMTEGVASHILTNIKTDEDMDKLVNGKGPLYFMVDEAHMLTKEGVLLMYKLLKLQENPLFTKRIKLIFSTATANRALFQQELSIPNEGVREVSVTPKHEVEPYWAVSSKRKNLNEPTRFRPDEMATDAVERIRQVLETPDYRHVIAFLPGKGELQLAEDKLKPVIEEYMKTHPTGVKPEIMWIHGGSTQEEKDVASSEAKKQGKKIIFLATNAAQTGITLEGITDVIISGLARQTLFNPRTGIEQLLLQPLSRADIIQMRGRSGRTNNGRVHYLYINERDYNQLLEFPVHDTRRSELTNMVLSLKQMGVDDVYGVRLFTELPKQQLDHAILTLKRLGALDEQGKLTPDIGEYMSNKPVDYHLARALFEAEKPENHCIEEISSISAILGVQGKGFFMDLRTHPNQKTIESSRLEFRQKREGGGEIRGSDFLVVLNIWRSYDDIRRSMFPGKMDLNEDEQKDLDLKRDEWCKKYGISFNAMQDAEKLRTKVLDRCKIKNPHIVGNANTLAVEKCIAIGYRDRLLTLNNNETTYRLFFDPLNDRDISEMEWRSKSPKVDIIEPRRAAIPSTVYLSEKVKGELVNGYVIADTISTPAETDRHFASMVQRVLPGMIPGI